LPNGVPSATAPAPIICISVRREIVFIVCPVFRSPDCVAARCAQLCWKSEPRMLGLQHFFAAALLVA
jgi:hypothetical protein